MQQIYLAAFFLLAACNNTIQTKQSASNDSSQAFEKRTAVDTAKNVWIDRLNGIRYPLPDSIDGKPVSFYLNNEKVAPIAKALYSGSFRPTDNDSTTQLLSYVTTNDSLIRPFYRWCLDFTIAISDGALAEYAGVPALKYASKFPEEFFSYMDKDKSGQRYKDWTEIIAYSGLDNYEEKSSEVEKEIVGKMLLDCLSCNDSLKDRINSFAKDVAKAVELQN